MKKTTIILGLLSIMTLCLTACGKPKMSFEDAVNNVFHSELQEIVGNTDYYQQNFNISTKFFIPDEKIKGNITFSTDSKQNRKDSKGETNLARKFNASGDGEKVKIDGNAIIKQLKNTFYLKLNSLNISSTNEYFDADSLGINEYKGQRFFLDLNDEKIKEAIKNYYNLHDFSKNFKIKNLYNKSKTDKLINEFKESLTNEGTLVYSGIYSQFNGYNAYKFGINKEKALTAFVNYFRGIMPDDIIDEAMEDIEYKNRDKIFEGFPFTSFEGYLVITGKHKVQIIIENIDIDDYPHTSTLNATFGKDGYKLVGTEDGEDIIIISAILTGSHYDINMKVEDLETLTGTITPNISNGKVSIDFDLLMKFEDYGDLIKIPLQGGRTREKIPEFSVSAPKNFKNLIEETSKYNYYEDGTSNLNATEYNDKLVNIISECTDSTQTLFENYEKSDGSITVDSIKLTLEKTILICQNSANKLKDFGDYNGDSSLKDTASELLSLEISYLEKFLSTNDYWNIETITDENRLQYNGLVNELNELENTLNAQFLVLQQTQESFAKKYGLKLE